MGMFNNYTVLKNIEKRKIVIKSFADFLGVMHPVPKHIKIEIPLLLPPQSWFFDHKEKRGADDIDSLWDFFETALSFAESNNQDEKIKQRFIKLYNKVIKQYQMGPAKITMGLFWIRPRNYLTLDQLSIDQLSRTYLPKESKFKKFPIVDAARYLALIDELKKKFQHENLFPELARRAYEDKPSPVPSIAEEEPEYKPDDSPNPSETYGVDDIVKAGCFIAREELENYLRRLRSKQNIILQGPPGTGKTWLAKLLAYALVGAEDKDKLKAIQFHSNISYEDFVIGYRPSSDGKLELKPGAFLEMIHKAQNDGTNKYVVVIEEINRGNPAQVFGEMLTLLEADKRKEKEALQLIYSNEKYGKGVFVPANLFVIGTMNVADRSLALIDFALRRRFAFIDLKPNFGDKWKDWVHNERHIPKEFLEKIGQRMRELNDTITNTPSLGEQYKIGHSYFTPDRYTIQVDYKEDHTAWYREVIKTEIGPLLREYWFDDPKTAKEEVEKLIKGI